MSAMANLSFSNRITELFKIDYPIIQAGMVWCSGWRLASAVSNAGGLGLIGSGSMYPDILQEHIRKCKEATDRPFGVNIPLLYPDIEKHINVIKEEGVKIVFTSAGNPKTWTGVLKGYGVTVVHVVSNSRFAVKSQEAGVDAIVAEGFEAGGHNGREETTTICLLPQIKRAVDLPVIAAGGIATGRAMLAAAVLGAEGVQMGTRFVLSQESSAHENYKNRVVQAGESGTMLVMKQLTPVRLLKNRFFDSVMEYELKGESKESLERLLGKGRAKKGMFEGDIDEGELEIGQISGFLHDIKSAGDIVREVWEEFVDALGETQKIVNKVH